MYIVIFWKGLDKNGGRKHTGSKQSKRNSAFFSCQTENCTKNRRRILSDLSRAGCAFLAFISNKITKKEVEDNESKAKIILFYADGVLDDKFVPC